MSGAVDTRIVQMQFDNKDFERNIKTSEKSLEKFKKYLDFDKCEKGLNSFSRSIRNIDFGVLYDNVQKLTDKFTGLGTVTELVLSQIRRGIENVARSVSNLVNDLSFKQIGEGRNKFDELNKNVKTIIGATGMAEEEVYKVMERLNAYTDQTSYSFTDMAANIGKFTSVGIELHDAEKQMEGIANWAARSGAGINEASRAMYNLSQAMGVGKMTTIDWKSIENAGMATKEFKEQMIQAGLAMGTLEIDNKGTIKTAKSLGKQVEVNYENLRDTLNKGWANRQVLERTLMGYYYEDLKYENDTVLKLTEEQLKANEDLFKDYKIDATEWGKLESQGFLSDEVKQKMIDFAVQQKKLIKETDKNGKTIYKTIEKNGKQIEVTLENMSQTLEYGWLDKDIGGRIGLIKDLGRASYESAQKCMSFTDVLKAWKDQLSTGWMNVWRKIFGDLTESMELFSTICNKVGDSFGHFIEILVGDAEKGTKGIFGAFGDDGGRSALWSMLIGEYDGMYEGAYGLLDVFQDIGKMISDGFWMMVKMLDPSGLTMSSEQWLQDEEYRMEYLGHSLVRATQNIRDFIQGIKDFLSETPEGQVKTRLEMIQDVIFGISGTVATVAKSVGDIVDFVTVLFDDKHLGPAVDSILYFFSMLGQELNKTGAEVGKGKGLKAFFDDLLSIFGNKDEGLIKSINGFVDAFSKLILFILGTDSETSTTIGIWDSIRQVLAGLASAISHVGGPILDFFTSFLNNIRDLLSGKIDFATFAGNMKEALKTMFNSIFNFTPDFVGSVKGIWQSIKNVFTSGFSKESISELKEKVSALFGDFKKSIPGNVKGSLKTIYGNIKTFFQDTWKRIKDYFKPLFSDVKKVFTSGFSKESIDDLKKRLKSMFKSAGDRIPEDIKESFGGVTEKIKGFFKEKWESIKDFFRPLFTDIKNVFSSGFSKQSISTLKERFQTIFHSISDAIPSSFKESFANTVQNLKDRFKNLWSRLFGGSGSASDPTGELKKNNTFNAIITWAHEGWEKVKKYISGMFGGGSGGGGADGLGLKQKVSDLFKTDADTGAKKNTIFDQIIEWLKQGFEKVKNYVLGLFGLGKKKEVSSELTSFADGFMNAGVDSVKKKKKGIFSYIIDWLRQGFEDVKNFIVGLFTGGDNNADKKSGVLGTITNFASGILNSGDNVDENKKSIFDHIIDWAKKGVEKVKKYILGLFTGASAEESENTVTSYANDLLGINQSDDTKKGETIFDRIIDKIKEGIGKVRGFIQRLVGNDKGDEGSLWNEMKKWDLSTIALIIVGALGVVGLIKIIKKIMGAVDTLLSIGDNIAKIPKNLNEALNGKEKPETTGDKFLKIAGAIAIIAAALIFIGNMETGKAIQGTVIIALIMAGLIVMLKIVKKTFKGMTERQLQAMDKAILAMIVFAASVFVLVQALMPLSKMGWGDAARMGAGLVLIILAYAAVAMLLKKYKNSFKWDSMVGLIAFAGSIWLLIQALLPLKNISKPVEWLRMFGGLALVLLAIFAFVKLTNKFAKGADLKGMAGLGAVVAAVALLVFTLTPLSLISWEGLAKMVSFLGVVLLEIAGFLALVMLISKIGGSGLKNSGMGQLAAVAAAIAILVIALLPIALLKKDQVDQMVSALAKIMLVLVVLIAAVGFLNKTGAGLKGSGLANLLAVAGAIVILVIAMLPLALMKPEQIAQALTAIIVLMAGLALFMILVDGIKMSKSGLVQLIAVAATIVILVLAMIPLTLMPLDKMLWAAGVLIGLMLAMALLMVAIGKLKVGKQALTNIGLLAVLAVTIVLFADALDKVKNVKATTMLAFAAALTIMIIGMAAAIFILSKVNIGAGLIAIALLAVAIGALALLIPLIMNAISSGLENMMAKLANVSDMFRTFSDNMDKISEESLNAAKRKFETLMDIIYTVRDAGSYQDAVKAFERAMLQLGNAISQFMFSTRDTSDPAGNNGIKFLKEMLALKDQFSGFSIGNFANDMALLGEAIANFGTATSETVDQMGQQVKVAEDPEKSNAFKFITAMLEHKDDLANFSMGTFKTDVADLGEAIANFGTAVATSEASDTQLSAGIKMIVDLANQATNLEKISKLPIQQIKTNIAGLGGALSIYAMGASEADGLNEDEVPNVQKAVELMRSVMTTLNEEGGITELPTLPTEGALTEFGTELAALAIAMKSFADASKDLDHVDKATELLGFLVTLREKLTEQNVAAVTAFSGQNISQSMITSFGLEIGSLGTSLRRFAKNTKDFTFSQNLKDALEFFVGLHEYLTETSIKSINAFNGQDITKDKIVEFGTQIGSLGTSLKRFSNNTKDFNMSQNVKDALIFFANLKKYLKPTILESILSFNKANVTTDDLTTFGTQIGELGEALGKFAENVNFDEGKQKNMSSAIQALEDMASIARKLPVIGGLKGWIHGNAQTIGDLAEDFTKLGSGMANFSTALTRDDMAYNAEIVGQAMENLMSFAQIISYLSEDIAEDGIHFKLSATVAANYLGEFFTALSKNWIDDINYTEAQAEAGEDSLTPIEHMVQVISAFTKELNDADINTSVLQDFKLMAEGLSALFNSLPSLNYQSLGEKISTEIITGIHSRTADVKEAILALIDLNSIFSEDSEWSPTVKPIVDLTDAEEGAGILKRLFDNPYGLSVGEDGVMSIDLAKASLYAEGALPKDQTSNILAIKDEVAYMRDDLKGLMDSMSKMKFVMNTGAVVAAIGPEMDEYLGQQGYLSFRSRIP